MCGVSHGPSYTAPLANGKSGISCVARDVTSGPSGGSLFGKMKLMDRVSPLADMRMEKVLIIGASGGIGSALVAAFSARGASVTGLSRSADGLDVTDAGSVSDHLAGLGPFDRVVVATGALEIAGAAPEKTIKGLDPAAMMDQFALNTVGPALALSHAHTLLRRDQGSVFAVLSARVGSIGDNRIGGWISYRSAKAAVNQVVRTAAVELGRSHPEAAIVALHPGTVATAFTEKYLGRHPAVLPEQAAEHLVAVMDGLTSAQSGQFLDYAGKEVVW